MVSVIDFVIHPPRR